MTLKSSLLKIILFSGCFTIYAADLSASFVKQKQPLISSVSASGITTISATISWLSSDQADSQVEYGATAAYGSLTTLDPTLTRSHAQILKGLTPNTLYHYAVMSRTAAGTLYQAGDYTFSTPPVLVDNMISGLNVSGITATSAVVSWTTTAPANSIVEFGSTTSYGQFSPLSPQLVTSHTVVLAGLGPETVYHVRARSADAAGNLGISVDASFSTVPDLSSPAFSGISASVLNSNSATISWTTGFPATSQVEYGTGPGYGSSTTQDPTLGTFHSQALTGLTPNTLYHYRVKATGSEDAATSADYTFTTPAINLFYPQFTPDGSTYTGIALSNMDAASAQITFTAFDATGFEILANNLTNPANLSIGAGDQLATIQNQLFGSGVTGVWPLGSTIIGSSTPRLAGFFLTFNSSLSFMDGAEISTKLLKSFVLPEVGNQDYTTLLIANPNPAGASLTVDLVKTDGTVRSSVQMSIPAYGTYSADLVTATFAGVSGDPSDYVRITSTPGLLPYEFFGNISKDAAVLAGQDLTAGSKTLYSPQYVVGAGWTSILSIINLDSVAGTVTLALIGDDGSQIGATKTVPVAANGKIYVPGADFFLGSAPSGVIQGYVRVSSNDVRLSGSVTFSDAINGAFATALPLVSTVQPAQILPHVASNSTYFTGLAILNPNSTDATVTIEVYTAAGQRDSSTTQVLQAGHGVSRLLTEYFPALVGQDRTSGYIKVAADKGVACYGLFGTSSLSAVSAIPTQSIQ